MRQMTRFSPGARKCFHYYYYLAQKLINAKEIKQILVNPQEIKIQGKLSDFCISAPVNEHFFTQARQLFCIGNSTLKINWFPSTAQSIVAKHRLKGIFKSNLQHKVQQQIRQYVDQIEMLHEIGLFSFNLEQIILHKSDLHKMVLSFQLFRYTNQHCQQTQKKLGDDFECVSLYSFEIKVHQNLSFVQYFDFRFQLPYCAQVCGIVSCLLVNFQLQQGLDITKYEDELKDQNKLQKVKNYGEFISFIKKIVKQHRFSSYSIQKTFEQTFLGFKTAITIPSAYLKNSIAQRQDVTRQMTYRMEESSQKAIQQLISSDLSSETGFVKVPKLTKKVFSNSSEKKCSQEDFMNYLAYIDSDIRKVDSLLNQLKYIGYRNIQVFKQIISSVSNIKQDLGLISFKVNLNHASQDFQSKKSIIYGQRTTELGKSLSSAAQEIKIYEKILSSLKSKQKENFFTMMSQIFNLIPNPQCQPPSTKFDKCPYVFYSNENMENGVKSQDIDESDFDGESLTKIVQPNAKKVQMRNVFILAHGYQASSSNMQKFKICLKKIFPKSKIFLLKSYSNHMDRKLQEMGQKAAKQIEAYIQHVQEGSSKKIRLILVGHSMGGIILRASFQYLSKKTRSLFHTFISFATPHLGYLHCKSLLTETGIKIIQSMHPSASLKQLSNKDNTNVKETFIYKLANLGSLKQFTNVIVLSSIQDKYVPWNSARIQLYKEPQGVGGKNTTGGWSMCSEKHYLRFVELQMITQIFGVGQKESKVRNIHRFEIDFNINHVNLDTMIGRTAHVSFLGNQHIFSIMFENILAKSLYTQLKTC